MGKRKKSSRKPQGPKKKELLATTFQCLFCNHEKSVIVKLEKKAGIGMLSCKVCGQSFQTGINYLSAAIDVYSDWIDACDAVANGEAPDAVGQVAKETYRNVDVSSRGAGSRAEPGLKDDFIDDDEDDMAGIEDDD